LLSLFVADKPLLPVLTPLLAQLWGAYDVAAPRMMGALLSTLLGKAPEACVEIANCPASADLVGVAGSLRQRPVKP